MAGQDHQTRTGKFRLGKGNLGAVAATVVLIAALAALATGQEGEKSRLSFSAGNSNEFTFDTGLLRGQLCAGGKSIGLSSVVHIPSGTRLDRSMGLFSHYQVFTQPGGLGHHAAPGQPARNPAVSNHGLDGGAPVRAARLFRLVDAASV